MALPNWPSAEDALYFCAALASTFVIFFVLKLLFSNRPSGSKSDSPASHFALKELLSSRAPFYLTCLCAVPFAALFLILCLKASTLVDAGKDFLVQYAISKLDPKFSPDIKHVLTSIPRWLDPFLSWAAHWRCSRHMFVLPCCFIEMQSFQLSISTVASTTSPQRPRRSR